MEQKHPIAWHVPNLINICIDSVEDGEMTGKIYHCYSEEAIAFSNIIRMIETVEEFFDCLQFPQAATQTRSFHRKESVEFILAGISPMGGRRRSLAVCQCTGIYQNIK